MDPCECAGCRLQRGAGLQSRRRAGSEHGTDRRTVTTCFIASPWTPATPERGGGKVESRQKAYIWHTQREREREVLWECLGVCVCVCVGLRLHSHRSAAEWDIQAQREACMFKKAAADRFRSIWLHFIRKTDQITIDRTLIHFIGPVADWMKNRMFFKSVYK